MTTDTARTVPVLRRPVTRLILSVLLALTAIGRLGQAMRTRDKWEAAFAMSTLISTALRIVVTERRHRVHTAEKSVEPAGAPE